MGITNYNDGNKRLLKSASAKNDEFYTQYKDVELLLNDYQNDLRDKIIYCNCDMEYSNFVKYLKDNKEKIGYKKLLYTGLTKELTFGEKYNVGDFRHSKSVEILKLCDVVITNPPFSLIGEWYSLIKKYNKKFIVLAPNTFVSRKIIRNDFVNGNIFINMERSYHTYFDTPAGEKKEIKSWFYTNIKKIKYHYKDTSKVVFMKDCSYVFYDNTDVLCITDGEKIPQDYNGLFTLSINQCWHFDFEKYDLISFTNDYHKKLLINNKEQFVRILCRKKLYNSFETLKCGLFAIPVKNNIKDKQDTSLRIPFQGSKQAIVHKIFEVIMQDYAI